MGPRPEAAFIIVPAIVDFMKLRSHNLKENSWILLCEPETRVNVTLIHRFLLQQMFHVNTNRHLWWGGKSLVDDEISIRHHFSPARDLRYPLVPSGILFTRALAESISMTSLSNELAFRIDTAYEFAKLLRDQFNNTLLNELEEFCVKEPLHHEESRKCATWTTAYYWTQHCKPAVPKADVLVAVKTCQRFFKDRIPLVKATWASQVENLIYFAEVADSTIPTVNIGVDNTEYGHCGKLLSILKYIRGHDKWSSLQFVVIVDDDTLINEYRLRSVLACYLQDMGTLALGEKYGYLTWHGDGYSYITGGGGMVLSVQVIDALLQSSSTFCPSIDSPDDMMLGQWLRRLNLPITHSHLFHQARPMDYAHHLVNTDYHKAISYHKFWMIEDVPLHFTTWLQDVHESEKSENKSVIIKDEL